MKVLVGYASRYGSTDTIAHQIGGVLVELGLDVTVARLNDAEADGYDAYVIGSAVYAGNWMRAARRFVERNSDELRRRRVWFFSSGPVGRPPRPEGLPAGVVDFDFVIQPEEHMVFAGKLERSRLGFIDRAVAAALQAPEGDFRDWSAVQRWAVEIGEALKLKIGTA